MPRKRRVDFTSLNVALTGGGPTRLTWNGLRTGSAIDAAAAMSSHIHRHAVWYGVDAGVTYVYADTSGDGQAEIKLQLLGAPTLAVSNFLGVNARVVIAPGGASGAVAKQANQTGSVAVDTATGSLSFTDADVTNVHTVAVAENGGSYLGTLSATVIQAAGSGTVNWTFSVPDSTLDYLAADDTLVQSYTVTLTDNFGASASQEVTITITGANDAPTTSAVTLAAIAEDRGFRLITQAELLANAADIDGPSLTATGLAIVSGSGGLVDHGDGTWSYTPVSNDDASVSFSYTVTDGSLTAAGSATRDITPENDAPSTSAVTSAPIAEDSGARLITQAELLANAPDIDGPSLTATGLAIVSGSGILVDNLDGTWSYTPASNDDTSVTFSYTVTDGSLTAGGRPRSTSRR